MTVVESNLQNLMESPICILRMSPDEWSLLADTRRRGTRFSLNFPHDEARGGQRNGLVLVDVIDSGTPLRLGLIASKRATTTLDSAIVFDLVRSLAGQSLQRVLAAVTEPELRAPRDRLATIEDRFQRVSPKPGEAILRQIAAIPENAPLLVRLLEHLRKPKKFTDARALQADAVALALKAFGADEASAIALPGVGSSIGIVRLLEDAVIEHDARWIGGWHLADSVLTGRAAFERGGEQLQVFTANRRPLEKLFGVDLIYLNEARGALVMVQYKMLEPGRREFDTGSIDPEDFGTREWLVRIDEQFHDEIGRMRMFDKDLEPEDAYRLNSGAFFFKLVRRNAAVRSAGILMSLGHLEHLLERGALRGPSEGLRVSYHELAGHYLRSDPFIELVRSGYIGTRGATTRHLQALIQASLDGGNAVVAGLQSALRRGDKETDW